MMVYLISAVLIGMLLLMIWMLSRRQETEQEIRKLAAQSPTDLLDELRSVTLTNRIFFVGGMLLTVNYAISYFSGSDLRHIESWGAIQWGGALVGVVITLAITAAQWVLYSTPSHHRAGVLVTVLILTFVIFSEISAPMEREQMKVLERSRDSETFRAVVRAIEGPKQPDIPADQARQLAEWNAALKYHQYELNRCDRWLHQVDKKGRTGPKRVRLCEEYENGMIAHYQGRIESLQALLHQTLEARREMAVQMVDQARKLEANENMHSPIIKLVKEWLGASYVSAMALAAIILVVAFEAGFHFTGKRRGLLRAAIARQNAQAMTGAVSPAVATVSARPQAGAALRQPEPAKLGPKPGGVGDAPPPQDEGAAAGADTQTPPARPGTDRPAQTPAPENENNAPGGNENTDELVDEYLREALYLRIVTRIKNEEIPPTNNPLVQEAYGFLKENGISITMPQVKRLAQWAQNRMVEEGIIRPNPDRRRGVPRFIVS